VSSVPDKLYRDREGPMNARKYDTPFRKWLGVVSLLLALFGWMISLWDFMNLNFVHVFDWGLSHPLTDMAIYLQYLGLITGIASWRQKTGWAAIGLSIVNIGCFEYFCFQHIMA
jgi:hypothetical protein